MNEHIKKGSPLAILILAALGLAGCPGPEPPAEIPDDIFAPMGEVIPTATEEQRATFERGRLVALHRFTQEEGLGPAFNLSFCGGCHERPVTGGGGARYRDFLLVGQALPDGSFTFTGVNGIQPQFDLESGRRSDAPGTNVRATRNPIPFFGTGLIAELPESSIRANEDPEDRDGDGISGRVNIDRGFVGRFGRKAQTVSIEGFIRGPLFNHLGITSDPLSDERKNQLPVPSGTPATTRGSAEGLTDRGDPAVRGAVAAQAAAPDEPTTDFDSAPDPELSEQDLFDVVSFSMLLAAPQPDEPTEESEAGRALFEEANCSGCHVHTLEGPRGLIPLYSDLLLHDMGPDLADGILMGLATSAEFRTQPLWGVSAVGPYLHDGRADTLDEAIRAHGGEAQGARDAYVAMSEADQTLVIRFLESLGGYSQHSPGLLPRGTPVPDAGAYGGPATELSAEDRDLFVRGRAVFDRDAFARDGLGPTFNGDSCRACHFDPVIGGSGPADVNVTRQGIFEGDVFTAPAMGTMAHRHGLGPMRPPIDEASNFFELRQTPTIFGLGLLEQVPEAVIMALADPDDLDGDGISGRAHILPDGRLGRLGWKADVPDLAEFARDGLTNELGLTVPDQPGLTFGRGTDGDEAADPEIPLEDVEALVFYMQSLAPPPRDRSDVAREDAGEAVFASVGCASCHATLSLGDGTEVRAYTDVLLHDVAEPSSRGIASGDAGIHELRTAPLWGIGHSGPYMHHGLAFTIEEAIADHFGEAEASRMAFEALSAEDRENLLLFLRSL